MTTGERYRAFAIDQAGNVCGILASESSDTAIMHLKDTPRGKSPSGPKAGGAVMVEAAGQPIWFFRARLDYAFTPAKRPGAGRVIRRENPSVES